jgi:hypothetical protein
VPLRDARQLFASMSYEPALAETDALLRQHEVTAGDITTLSTSTSPGSGPPTSSEAFRGRG